MARGGFRGGAPNMNNMMKQVKKDARANGKGPI